MKRDWMSCDGTGRTSGPAPVAESTAVSVPNAAAIRFSRRGLIAGGALGAVGWAAAARSALADITLQPGKRQPEGDILVTIFLRGGADGLNIVPPTGDDDYHRARPSLRIHAASDRGAGADRAIDLDGFFGFHPAMAPVAPLFREGKLAVIHACGSGDQSRSHFEAMAAMERGLATDASGTSSGWIARHLAATESANRSPMRAVAFSSVMPDLLRGTTNAMAITSLSDFRLDLPAADDALRDALEGLYTPGRDEMAHAGRETLSVLDTLRAMDPSKYRPDGGAVYPESELGLGLKQVACLIKGDVGLEVACLDKGNWDTHVAQGAGGGWLASLLDDVAKSMAAFAFDLGREMNRVTLVVMTEFGRRLHENTGLGTDHGRASVMLVLGGGVSGGRVHGSWPGLSGSQLEGGIDLRVTTDYRDVLGEIVSRRMRNPNLGSVFPGHRARPVGVVV